MKKKEEKTEMQFVSSIKPSNIEKIRAELIEKYKNTNIEEIEKEELKLLSKHLKLRREIDMFVYCPACKGYSYLLPTGGAIGVKVDAKLEKRFDEYRDAYGKWLVLEEIMKSKKEQIKSDETK